MSYILLTHVIFGTTAIFAGFVTIVSQKGQRIHRLFGRVYVISMLIMSCFGAIAATINPQAINVLAALLTSYLIITAFHAAKSQSIERGTIEYASFIFIGTLTLLALLFGIEALVSEDGTKDGFGYEFYFFICAICTLAASGDLYGLLKGYIKGKQKIARHVWRMCFSYFIAVGSLFTGPGATAFPQFIRDSGILSLPEPAVLLVLIYWVYKTLRTDRFS